MASCPSCGHDYGVSEYRFCLDCGDRLIAESETPTVIRPTGNDLTTLPNIDWSSETMLAGGRIVVNATPEYLEGLSNSAEHTTAQADRLKKSYVGKWIQFDGSIYDAQNVLGELLVMINRPEGLQGVAFEDTRQIEIVDTLKKNDPIKVICKICLHSNGSILYKEAELVQ